MRLKTSEWIFSDKREGGCEMLKFKSVINVSADGTFYTYLPDDVLELLKDCGLYSFDHSNKKQGKVIGGTLNELKENVKSICEDYLSKEIIKSEPFIEYQIVTACSYQINSSGEFVPNGHWNDISTNDNNWHSGTIFTHANSYIPHGIRIYARPMIRHKWEYKSGKKYDEVQRMNRVQCEKIGPNVHFLNSVVGIGPITGSFRETVGDVYEMPCTEENASFFVSILKGLWAINHVIKDKITPKQIETFVKEKKLLPFPNFQN